MKARRAKGSATTVISRNRKRCQHGEIGPFNIKLVAPSFEQGLNCLLNAALFPEPPKNQFRSDPQHLDRLSLPSEQPALD